MNQAIMKQKLNRIESMLMELSGKDSPTKGLIEAERKVKELKDQLSASSMENKDLKKELKALKTENTKLKKKRG